jgi:hypothetical protein
MTTDFTVLSGITVTQNYNWDKGLPFTVGLSAKTNPQTLTISDINDSTSIYISGYAPGFRVFFKNNSSSDPDFSFINYNWDFGDFYNDSNNTVSLCCLADVEHTYIMPGQYTVSLTLIQSKEQTGAFVGETQCLGKYNYQWYWDNLVCDRAETVTWDEAACNGIRSKWWDNETQCFQKYCKFWSWYDLRSASEAANPVTWEQTMSVGPQATFTKKWAFEANDTVCTSNTDTTFINTVITQSQTTIKTAVVEVFELIPVAKLYLVSQPVSGISPLSVQISPRNTIAGSFPIDRIDWDPGDGTPIKTVTRYTTPNSNLFTYTSAFSADMPDPRNYDFLHTYKRTIDTYSMFYPSITAYSSSTGTKDSCSLTVGPVALSSYSNNISLLKGRNTPTGNLYSLQIDNNVTFVTTQTGSNNATYTLNKPQNIIRNSFGSPVIYKGNPGTNYPPIYTPTCFPPIPRSKWADWEVFYTVTPSETIYVSPPWDEWSLASSAGAACVTVFTISNGQTYTILNSAISSCIIEANYNTTLGSCVTSTGITFINNAGTNVSVKVEGSVDDEFVVNGSVYEPGAYPFNWNTVGSPCGSTNGDNGAHNFTYYDTLSNTEVILFQAKDNGFGGSSTWTVYLSV